jgi:uncharacterized membrane protein
MMTFCNAYRMRIWTAVCFHDDEFCGGEGGGWRNRGWWGIDPGACVQVHSGIVSNVGRYWYIYGEAADLSRKWEGAFPTYIKDPEVFDICQGLGSSAFTVRNFAQIDTGDVHNYTLTFT